MPSRRIRKTVWAGLILVVLYLLSRIAFYTLDPENIIDLDKGDNLNAKQEVYAMCAHIVDGKPLVLDSVFSVKKNIYAYSQHSHRTHLMHHWFLDSTLVFSHLCSYDTVCISTDHKKMQPGEWSVDFVEGDKLKSTVQFRVLAKENPCRK
ncbi:MAG: hypothetical protein GX801_01865 [Fibrobacter sp.]|nr:hypothetical protein [Fibrobacter sp.]